MEESTETAELLKYLWDTWQTVAFAVKDLGGWVQNPGLFQSSKDCKKLAEQFNRVLGQLTDIYTATIIFATEECSGIKRIPKEASTVEMTEKVLNTPKTKTTDDYPI